MSQAPAPAPKQPVALIFLSLFLFAGLLVIGFLLVNDSRFGTPPTPTYRPTNTPDIASDANIIPINPPQTLTDFTALGTDNQPIRLSDLRGKYTLLYFGYTNCPDACPLTMAQFTQTKAALGDRAAEFNFVMASIDPQRDTPQDVRAYLDQFDASFIGMILSDEVLNPIADEYGFSVERPVNGQITAHNMPGMSPATPSSATAEGTAEVITALDGGPLINHSTFSYLIDREGNLRAIFYLNTPTEAFQREIERVLAADA
ncbi:MAG: SCO family protein [Anaerolineae bacterium]